MRFTILLFTLFSFFQINATAQAYTYQLALLKYNGGGDWYANLETSLPNLIAFCNKELNMNINPQQATAEASSSDLFNYPFVHVTGHGNIVFSEQELKNLRSYLLGGGFMHIDDNYGMNNFIRIQLERLFPTNQLVELPVNHLIFKTPYEFPNGLPKIHEHDGDRPQAFGIFIDGKLVLLYTYETDLGDGWEDTEVHNDSEETHLKALKMGANIIQYAFENTLQEQAN